MKELVSVELLKISKMTLARVFFAGFLILMLVVPVLVGMIIKLRVASGSELRSILVFPLSLLFPLQVSMQVYALGLLAIAAYLFGSEYSLGTWKTIVPCGRPRSQLILSKLLALFISATILLVGMSIIFQIAATATSLILGFDVFVRSGLLFPATYLTWLVVDILWLFLYASIAVVFSILSRSPTTGLFCGFLFLLADVTASMSPIGMLLPQKNIEVLLSITRGINHNVVPAIVVFTAYLLAPSWLTLRVFEAQDIDK